jgi:hypothetical protein
VLLQVSGARSAAFAAHSSCYPPPRPQILAAAIRAGNVTRVQSLLPKQRTPLGFSVLQAACSGQRDVLEVRPSRPIAHRLRFCTTSITIPASSRDTCHRVCCAPLQLLLDAMSQAPASLAQPPPLPADALGRSPLHFAAANGDYGAAQLLLARGADVNVRPSRAAAGSLVVARGRASSTPLCQLARGHNMLGHCLFNMQPTALPLWRLPCCRLQAADRDGMTPVAYAAAAGHRGLMELLLEAGADAGARGAGGATPLLLAAGALPGLAQLENPRGSLVCGQGCWKRP